MSRVLIPGKRWFRVAKNNSYWKRGRERETDRRKQRAGDKLKETWELGPTEWSPVTMGRYVGAHSPPVGMAVTEDNSSGQTVCNFRWLINGRLVRRENLKTWATGQMFQRFKCTTDEFRGFLVWFQSVGRWATALLDTKHLREASGLMTSKVFRASLAPYCHLYSEAA